MGYLLRWLDRCDLHLGARGYRIDMLFDGQTFNLRIITPGQAVECVQQALGHVVYITPSFIRKVAADSYVKWPFKAPYTGL
jgi:hypothetical protein